MSRKRRSRAPAATACENSENSENSSEDRPMHLARDSAAAGGKRPSASQASSRAKKRRKAITIGVKLDVISRIERNECVADIGRLLDLNESTVRTIRNNAARIKESANAGTSVSAARTSYARSSVMGKMERTLRAWIDERDARDATVSTVQVQARARAIYGELTEGQPGAKAFTASTGWFANFRRRYNFRNIRAAGRGDCVDAADADADADAGAAAEFVATLRTVIKEGRYSPRRVFNLDESVFYWRQMPSGSAGESGPKQSRDRYTLLLGGNAYGDCKLKPVVVYNSANPRALRGCSIDRLPVHFYSNAKGWMNANIFREYFVSRLRDELRRYCAREGLEFKILLLVRNGVGDPPSIQKLCENVRVVFVPKDIAFFVQPVSQGLTAALKAFYVKETFAALAKATEGGGTTAKEFWKNFTVRDSVVYVARAWRAVPRICMKAVWRKLCPYLPEDSDSFDFDKDVSESQSTVPENAELDKADFREAIELLNSRMVGPSTEDLPQQAVEDARQRDQRGQTRKVGTLDTVNIERLTDALRLIQQGLAILNENDPAAERSSEVTRTVLASLQCYSEILKEEGKEACNVPSAHCFVKMERLDSFE